MGSTEQCEQSACYWSLCCFRCRDSGLSGCRKSEIGESFCLSAGNTLNDLTALLNASLDDFYTHHVLLPQERKDKHFDLVLGATQGNDTRLWLSDQTVLPRWPLKTGHLWPPQNRPLIP